MKKSVIIGMLIVFVFPPILVASFMEPRLLGVCFVGFALCYLYSGYTYSDGRTMEFELIFKEEESGKN